MARVTLVLTCRTMEDRWLSISEICKLLGVCNDAVYKWIDKHGMPAHHMGRRWIIENDWLEAIIALPENMLEQETEGLLEQFVGEAE